uniref:Transcription factor 21-like n=1 Tax=Petromyzon marinus TaxID=7757 RepID=A0AAJ7TYZ6_PETMA|nr:transcription factor 21-like [Petromyzon marinus]
MSTGSSSDPDERQDVEATEEVGTEPPPGSADVDASVSYAEDASVSYTEDASVSCAEDECPLGGVGGGAQRRGGRANGERGACAGSSRRRPQRGAANARERARMRVLSSAFSRLKHTLPWVPPDTKLSKLDTLRLASSYIAHLRRLLDADARDGGGAESPSHPASLTWPFAAGLKGEAEYHEVGSGALLCKLTSAT